MEAKEILKSDFLDILFDGKNKAYGAYELRKSYNSRMMKAMLGTLALLVLLFVGTLLAKATSSDSEELDVLDNELAEIKKEEALPAPPPPPPPPPPKPPPPPEINQVKFVPPKIVKDELVKPEEKIEEIKEDAVISQQTVISDNKIQVVQAPVVEKGVKVVEVPKVADDENKIFTKVEKEAEYPGGLGAWRRFLEKNIDPQTPVDGGAAPGTYTVIVKFIVSKDGKVSDVEAESSHGFGMEKEAIRAIQKGPNWVPALQNGKNVNAYRRQPITFVVPNE